MVITRTLVALALLALAGCGSTPAPVTKPRPSPAATPWSTPPPSRFALYTHCGIREARIAGRYYVVDKPLGDGNGNPPAGWNNPFQDGTMTLSSPSTAVFRDSKGHHVTFRLRPRATGFLQICS
jgi:hypothetical protein